MFRKVILFISNRVIHTIMQLRGNLNKRVLNNHLFPEVSGPTPGQSNPDLSTSSTVTLPPKSFSSGSGSLKRAAAPVSPVAATAGAAAGSATGGSGGEAVVSAYKWEDESNGEIYTDVPLTASASEVSKVEKRLFEGPQLKSEKFT